MAHQQPTRSAMTERDSREVAPGRAKAHRPGCGEPEPVSPSRSRSVAPRADAVVSGLRSSPMFALAVQVYRVHQRDCAGRCRSCASRICRSRVHAATVIAAAGVNPADVDAPVRCGSVSRRRQQRGASAGRRSPVWVTVARGVRSRPSPECRGRTRPCGWSRKSLRDQPHRREGFWPAGRLLASLAEETMVHSDLMAPASSTASYPLLGWLFCACGERFFRWGSPDSTREYMSVCGCRLRPIDADVIERRVRAEAALAVPALAAGRGSVCPVEVLVRLFSRIEVGGTVADVRFVACT
jgi:hypothetical protein